MKHEFSCLGYICTCSKNETKEIGLKMSEEQFEVLTAKAVELGFRKAIRALLAYKPDGSVTNCIHSSEWALWLEDNMARILTESKKQ